MFEHTTLHAGRRRTHPLLSPPLALGTNRHPSSRSSLGSTPPPLPPPLAALSSPPRASTLKVPPSFLSFSFCCFVTYSLSTVLLVSISVPFASSQIGVFDGSFSNGNEIKDFTVGCLRCVASCIGESSLISLVFICIMLCSASSDDDQEHARGPPWRAQELGPELRGSLQLDHRQLLAGEFRHQTVSIPLPPSSMCTASRPRSISLQSSSPCPCVLTNVLWTVVI